MASASIPNIIALVISVLVLLIYMRLCWVVCFTIPGNQKKMLKELKLLNRPRRG